MRQTHHIRCYVAAGLLIISLPLLAHEAEEKSAKKLFEDTCSQCHSLALPQSQHLNRANWEWVVDDMINEFGCPLADIALQTKIIDYLVENYGTEK